MLGSCQKKIIFLSKGFEFQLSPSYKSFWAWICQLVSFASDPNVRSCLEYFLQRVCSSTDTEVKQYIVGPHSSLVHTSKNLPSIFILLLKGSASNVTKCWVKIVLKKLVHWDFAPKSWILIVDFFSLISLMKKYHKTTFLIISV